MAVCCCRAGKGRGLSLGLPASQRRSSGAESHGSGALDRSRLSRWLLATAGTHAHRAAAAMPARS